MQERDPHRRVNRGPWLTLLLLFALGVPTGSVERRTTPGAPRLGGCKEIESRRVCKIDPKRPFLTLWWPTPRRTDALVFVDFSPRDLGPDESTAAGEARAGLQMDIKIPPGSYSLVLVDRTTGVVTDWKLEPWEERLLYDFSRRCEAYAETSDKASKACERSELTRLRGFGDEPYALASLAIKRNEQGDFADAAALSARAGRLFLRRGRLSRGIDAMQVAAFSTLYGEGTDVERFAAAERLLAEAAQALAIERERGTDYARGEAYHAFLANVIAQQRGRHVHARAWAGRAVGLMRQIKDFERLIDAWPQELDTALSIGEAINLDDFDEFVHTVERWLHEAPAAARTRIQCYQLAPLYVNRAWLALRLGEAGDLVELDRADEFSRLALEVERDCPDEFEQAQTHLARAAVLIARGSDAEAADELGWVQPQVQAFTQDNRARYHLLEAVLQTRGLDRDAGLDQLEELMNGEDRPEDRWLAALALAVEAADRQPGRANRAFAFADRQLAEREAPRLQGAGLDDPRRNGGLRVAHLLRQGLVGEAACAAREAQIRTTAAHRRVAAMSQASALSFMGVRAVREGQARAEASREQLSDAGFNRTTMEIMEDLNRSDQELQWASEGGTVPRCEALRDPAQGEVMVVLQPLPNGEVAVFQWTRAHVTVSYAARDAVSPAPAIVDVSPDSRRVLVLAGATDALASSILAAEPRAAVTVEHVDERPAYVPGLAQIWFEEDDGLDASSREIPRLERALTGRGWTVEKVTDVDRMRSALAMPAAPELLYIATHGTPGGLLTTSRGEIRQIDILLARSVPRIVIVAACQSEEFGATLSHAGSEVVIAGRGELVKDAAPALIEAIVAEGGVELDIDALVKIAARWPEHWVRLRNF